MARPSIFSKDYEKKIKRMKRRKISITLAIILLACVGLSGILNKNYTISAVRGFKKYIYDKVLNVSSNYKNKKEKVCEKQNEKDITNKVQNNENSVINNTNNTEKNNISLKKEEKFPANLTDGRIVNVITVKESGQIRFKDIESLENIQFDVSPDKKYLVLYNNINQDTLLVGLDKKVNNITLNEYVSTSSKKIFTKEKKLKVDKGFLWQGSPKFIDNNNILYVSRLPWLNNNHKKRIWKYDIEKKQHKQLYNESINGENIVFNKVQSGLMEIEVGNKNITIDKDGNIK